MFRGAVRGVLRNELQPKIDNAISLPSVGASIHLMALRYCTGQLVLDNDIQRQAWKFKDQADKRDANRTIMELEMKMILSACPANVLTLPLVGWFCSPKFDGLRSREKQAYKADVDHITLIFEKMQEFKLGRVLQSGREIMFQKKTR
jgi:hypothetical protein